MRNDDVILQLYLIRHAESMGNIETEEPFDVMNPPLTDHGFLQAKALSERMKNVKIDAVITSPLERAICTAIPISEISGVPIAFEPLLCEKDVCIGGKGFLHYDESDSDCEIRAEKIIKMLLEKHKGQAVAVVTHGEFLQYLLRKAMNIPSDTEIRFCVYNTSVSKINFREGKSNKLAFQNDISHLVPLDGDKTEWM